MKIAATDRRHLTAFLFLVLFAMTSAWAWMAPIKSNPDEGSHFYWGYAVYSDQIPAGRNVLVPEYLTESAPNCYAFHPEIPADCVQPSNPDATQLVEGFTAANNYVPLYYWLTGAPLRFLSGDIAFHLARELSALLFSLLAAIGLSNFVIRLRRPWLLAVVGLGCVTPMAISIGASYNPQSLEISAAIAFAGVCAPLMSRFISPAEITSQLKKAALILPLLILARSPAVAWAIMIVVALFIVIPGANLRVIFRIRWAWVCVASAALATLVLLAWMRFAPQELLPSNIAQGGFTGFLSTLFSRLGFLWHQSVGITGWLDTWLPSFWLITYGWMVLGLLIAVLLTKKIRYTLIALGSVAAFVVVPIVFQLGWYDTLGDVWQGRYSLPWMIPALLVMVRIVAENTRPPIAQRFGEVTPVIAAGVFLAVHLAFFLQGLHRYYIGAQRMLPLVIAHLDTIGWVTLFLYLCAVGALAVVIVKNARLTASAPQAPAAVQAPAVPQAPAAQASFSPAHRGDA